ncbi:ribosome recycling factor family protein [Vibrio splendidus]|uniref:ribosome recycling factor family protein n=1 Tax=Vibrio TaxID=662 RepID=UPI000769C718|nr:ribosome recycling factor family protein [Vibrio splendidus]
MFSVVLNSFVHRVPDKAQVIALAAENGCQLKRIRRSRNWILMGEEAQLHKLREQLSDAPLLWMVTAIDKVLPKPTVCLQQLLQQTPSMTIAQLVSESGCSLAEARIAIDEFEGL